MQEVMKLIADVYYVLQKKKSRKELLPVVFSKVTKVVLPFYVSLKYINVM